jgi:hypothetical protein
MPSIKANDELEQRMLATERLLGTLIAILSARDPRLLDELQAVFASPDLPPKRWTGLSRSAFSLGGADVAQG